VRKLPTIEQAKDRRKAITLFPSSEFLGMVMNAGSRQLERTKKERVIHISAKPEGCANLRTLKSNTKYIWSAVRPKRAAQICAALRRRAQRKRRTKCAESYKQVARPRLITGSFRKRQAKPYLVK
jgi:hypothetical protein